MLSVKKVLAGRGAVDYYLNQTRRGLADYYLADNANKRSEDGAGAQLTAPGSSWWGGGAAELGLSGEIDRDTFEPLYAQGVRPDGSALGRRFRLPEEAAAAKAEALRTAGLIEDKYERWMARHRVRRTGIQASVAAWDCTFSPVKSVSLLWAAGDRDVQEQVWAAHTKAVDAGLAYLEEHASYVRAGKDGVRVLDTRGLVVARMNEWTSREGDMQIHTHCLVLNRACTTEDGKWRALDGRALLSARTGAGAVYNRTLEAELTRRLGVGWRDRPDGLRELDGVDDEMIEMFSTRRRAITGKLGEMIGAYRERYGIDPPAAVVSSMAQDATLATRPDKRELAPVEALDQWESTARERGRALAEIPRRVLDRSRPGVRAGDTDDPGLVGEVVARLASSGRATFSRHDVLRAALDALPASSLPPEPLRVAADRIVADVLTCGEVVRVTADDPVDVPDSLQRADGTSVYDQPTRHRWALLSTLDQERWLVEVATEPSGRTVATAGIDQAVAAHGLGDDQAIAVNELLSDDRRVGCLIGPAGAGKTRTLRAVVDAWQQAGGTVIGLTVSQAAASVLTDEAQVRAENTAKWLHETRRGQWVLPDRPLLLVDEASMVSTTDLVALVEQARRAGGRVLLVGDPAQLAAIHIGGGFDLLTEQHGAARLHEVRRFANPWEAQASMMLRRRDPTCLAEYAMRARIHGGTRADTEARLFSAWKNDTLRQTSHGRRASVLMIVGTNEQAAVLAEKARHHLVAEGVVEGSPTVALRDNAGSVGDHVVTRRNDRRLVTRDGDGWVVNGDVWTITAVHDDGSCDARRHRDAALLHLPTPYLAEHTHLAYATTAHRAQGMTVDRCHAAVTPDTSHQQLYVAATRGRDANHLWVAADADRQVVRDPNDLPAPEHTLARILQRHDVDRVSAHQVAAASHHHATSLARLGAIFEDAARDATDQWLHAHLESRGLPNVAGHPEWRVLVDRVRALALAGHDQAELVDRAVHWRDIDSADSPAAVLHWRLGQLDNSILPRRRPGPLASLPPADGPHIEVAQQAGELMRLRWREIRHGLAHTEALSDWLDELGPRPDDPAEQRSWLNAATAITAYRERFETPDYQPLLGLRPADSRPDAQTAYDHALSQVDRYLARPNRDLDAKAIAALRDEMQDVIDSRPEFDPGALQRAHRQLARQQQRANPPSPDREANRTALTEERRKAAHDRWVQASYAAAANQDRLAIADLTPIRAAPWGRASRR